MRSFTCNQQTIFGLITLIASLMCGLSGLSAQSSMPAGPKMVFGAECLTIGRDTELIAPLVDGQPDFKHTVIKGIHVKVDCGVLRVK